MVIVSVSLRRCHQQQVKIKTKHSICQILNRRKLKQTAPLRYDAAIAAKFRLLHSFAPAYCIASPQPTAYQEQEQEQEQEQRASILTKA
jgi:hypothetical protein